MVSIMFIMWEVRSAPKGKREVGVDENVWLTVVVSFTGCRAIFVIHGDTVQGAESYINYSYRVRFYFLYKEIATASPSRS